MSDIDTIRTENTGPWWCQKSYLRIQKSLRSLRIQQGKHHSSTPMLGLYSCLDRRMRITWQGTPPLWYGIWNRRCTHKRPAISNLLFYLLPPVHRPIDPLNILQGIKPSSFEATVPSTQCRAYDYDVTHLWCLLFQPDSSQYLVHHGHFVIETAVGFLKCHHYHQFTSLNRQAVLHTWLVQLS